MKQIILNVKNNQLSFVRTLLQQLDCVEIEEDRDSKKEIIASLTKPFKHRKVTKQGKLKRILAKDFLNEL